MPQFTFKHTAPAVLSELVLRLEHTARMITWFSYAVEHNGKNLVIAGSTEGNKVAYAEKRLKFYHDRNRFIQEVLVAGGVDVDDIENIVVREVAAEYQRCVDMCEAD